MPYMTANPKIALFVDAENGCNAEGPIASRCLSWMPQAMSS